MRVRGAMTMRLARDRAPAWTGSNKELMETFFHIGLKYDIAYGVIEVLACDGPLSL